MVCIPCLFAPLIPVVLILLRFLQPLLEKLGWKKKIEVTANCPINYDDQQQAPAGDAAKKQEVQTEADTKKDA